MKFKCKQTDKVIEFLNPSDIESMLQEAHYEVVEEEEEPAAPVAPVAPKPPKAAKK